MAPIEKMNGIATHRNPRHPRSRRTPPFHLAPQGKCKGGNRRMWHRAEAPFFQRKKETTSASTAHGHRTTAQTAMPDPHPALHRTETGDPPLKRGRRPGFPPGRCRTWDFSSGEGGAQRPPPPTGNPAITVPQVCKQTQRGRTQPGPRGFARRPGNPCSAQNCMEAAVKRTPSPLE